MREAPAIRAGGIDDLPALEELRRAVFPKEDLLPLVRRLLREEPGVLSPVATGDGALVGHVLLAPCAVGAPPVGPLGPLGAWLDPALRAP